MMVLRMKERREEQCFRNRDPEMRMYGMWIEPPSGLPNSTLLCFLDYLLRALVC